MHDMADGTVHRLRPAAVPRASLEEQAMHSLLYAVAASLLLATGFPLSAWAAADAAQAGALHADELVVQVLEQNRGLAALEAAVREAALRQSRSGVPDDPELSWDTAPRTYGSRIDQGQNIRVSQRIPWPGTLGRQQAQAGYERAARRHQLETARLETEALTRSVWAEWFFVHRALEINEENLAVLEDLRATVETRYAAGDARQQDVLRVEQERSRLEHQRIGYQRQQRSIRAQINALLHRPAQAALPPPAPDPAIAPLPALPASLDELLQPHPELQRLRSRVAERETGVELARLDAYPDLNVRAGYNSLWRDADLRWTVGISLNIPLDQRKRRAAVDEAEAGRIRSRMQLDEQRDQLRQQVVSAHAAAEESLHVIRLYRDRLLPLARETRNASLADYRSGAGAFLNVMDAEQERLRTELELLRARADYLRHLAELGQYTGGALPGGNSPMGGTSDE